MLYCHHCEPKCKCDSCFNEASPACSTCEGYSNYEEALDSKQMADIRSDVWGELRDEGLIVSVDCQWYDSEGRELAGPNASEWHS